MLATGMTDPTISRKISWRTGGKPVAILPVAGIFGANASGKTNVLRVMDDMRTYVLQSFRAGTADSPIPRCTYRLDEERAREPSTYEVELVIDGVRHMYGFSLDAERVHREWAYRWPHGKKALMFWREGDTVEVRSGNRAEMRPALQVLRSNALLLSTAAATKRELLLPLYRWFRRNLILADVESRLARQAITVEQLEDDGQKERVRALLQEADLGIVDARKRDMRPEVREKIHELIRVLHGDSDESSVEDKVDFDDFELRLLHSVDDGRQVEMHPNDESRGTMTWFGLIGPILEALHNGSVLLADEIDNSLHPSLIALVLALFQSKKTNPWRAQLIFNSHDVTQLGDSKNQDLSRDQVWFTEKLSSGATRLYALTDLNPRKHESIGQRYLNGRYGAIPIVSTRAVESMLSASGEDRES